MKTEAVDAVVVGAGASGGIVAKELAVAGWTVALLERGPWLQAFWHDETRDAWVPGMGDVPFGPAPDEVRTVRASDPQAGAKTVVPPRIVRESEAGISTHQLGSCRMGHDPKSSVTDASGRVHDVPNVFIADGSLLVNPGGSNPSLTIQALAYRVASKILRS